MKYIIKNLQHFYKTEKSVFLLTVCCSLLSVIMLFFSYGLFRVYHEKQKSDISELRSVQVAINGVSDSDTASDTVSDTISKTDLEQCLARFSPGLSEAIDVIFVKGRISDAVTLECRFRWEDGHYAISKTFADNMIKNNFSSVYFTPEQERQGSPVALVPERTGQGSLELQGRQYEVIGFLTTDETPIVPYASLNPDTPLDQEEGVYFSFSKAVSRQQYEELCDILTEQLGDKITIPPLPQLDAQNASFYNTMLLIALLIVFIAASNFAVQFHYICLRRKKMLAVYRLCGLDRHACMILFMAETVAIMLPVCLVGMFLFHICLLPVFIRLSADWAGIYHLRIYLLMLCADIGITGIVLFAVIRTVLNRETI